MVIRRSMHWTHRQARPTLRMEEARAMNGDEFLAREIVRHGAYVCVNRSNGGDGRAVAAAAVPALAERLGLQSEFGPGAEPARDSIAFLRRHAATPGDIADADVLEADGIV